MVDGFDVIGLNRDIGQANHVALKPGNNEAWYGCGVIQDSYLRNRKYGNQKILKTSCLCIKIYNVKRAQHSPRSAQLLLSYLWFIFFSSSFSLGICILILRIPSSMYCHNFFIDINIPIHHKKYRELPPTITFSHTYTKLAPCNCLFCYTQSVLPLAHSLLILSTENTSLVQLHPGCSFLCDSSVWHIWLV